MDFFAGANTRNGFLSIFEECLREMNRIYLLKGSSGCGKSTLMKRIAKKAELLSLETDRIYCSADPESLDGVIIKNLGVAVIDATAPHVMDPKYPAVRETIVNLGEFWDEALLIPRKQEITELIDKKGLHYKKAYSALSVAGKIGDIRKELIQSALDRVALEKEAFRIADSVSDSSMRGNCKTLFSTSFSADGRKTLPTFGDVNTLIRICGNSRQALINTLSQILKERYIAHTEALSPTDILNVESIYLHGESLLISILDNPPCESAKREKKISTSRLFLPNALESLRLRLRLTEKLIHELESDACAELSEARATHAQLESVYIPAMDFRKLDRRTESLIERIFEE